MASRRTERTDEQRLALENDVQACFELVCVHHTLVTTEVDELLKEPQSPQERILRDLECNTAQWPEGQVLSLIHI
eukprot:10337213-Alexandrium_andersonii.AAC.1